MVAEDVTSYVSVLLLLLFGRFCVGKYCGWSSVQRSICRGVGGFNPPLVEDDPHTGD